MARAQALQPVDLNRVGRDDQLAAFLERDVGLAAEGLDHGAALAAEPRLQRSRGIIDAGMDHARIVAGLMPGKARLLFQHQDPGFGPAVLIGEGGPNPDDPAADHHKIICHSRPP